MRNSSLHFSFYDGQDLKKLWSYATHHALVLELLTEAMDHDLSLHYAITEYARNDFQAQAMATIEERYKGQPETIEFYRAKFVGITQSAFDLSQNRMSQSPSSRDLQASLARRAALEIDILEAVKLDLDQKHQENARVGIALAASIPGFSGPGVGRWTLGEDWTDGYMAWNLAFTLSVEGPTSSTLFTKLLIPSVSCAVDDDSWIRKRTASLLLSLMYQTGGQKTPDGTEVIFTRTIGAPNERLGARMGQINRQYMTFSNPSEERVERMFTESCVGRCHDSWWRLSHTTFLSSLSDKDFPFYFGFVTWITTLMTGLGFELVGEYTSTGTH